jgi:hypothetical protein
MTNSFKSLDFPDRFIRHINFLGELTPIVSDLDKKDASFEIVPGLADGSFVSFRSLNIPDHFLRHQDFRLKLHPIEHLPNPNPGTFGPGPIVPSFAQDATFILQFGLADPTASSFECLNFRGRFIRHRDFHLFVEPATDNLSRKNSTFFRVPAFFEPPPPPPLH